MLDKEPNSLQAFGFLTALQDPVHGYFGGYLVLSRLGRPLEFRCCTPIQPSRAQQILYGPSLGPYLLAEVIGQSLISSAQTNVQVILTDQRDMLHLALFRPEPLAWISSQESDPAAPPATDSPRDWDRYQLRVPSLSPFSLDDLKGRLAPLVEQVDPMEPFGRITAALQEAGGNTPAPPVAEQPVSGDTSHAAAA
jgi:hypothetical protein